jgi:asparagine synthase (glutamine-hydrolysing)
VCGICGEISFGQAKPTGQTLERMTTAMERRGPDGSGIMVQNRMAFGHCRLKIIDLSDRSQQPMLDPELGLGIVFNGAIYNYRELKQELQTRGYRFFSEGDTEVLLKAYHAWGENFVERLSGMFAFAIWERDSGRVLLGRDRLGIKPLYLQESRQGLRFASSLPALLAAGDVDTSLDPAALHHYLTFHAVVPAPHTILRGVRKLPPATLLRIEADGSRQSRCYWQPDFTRRPGDEERSFNEWQDLVLESLRTAVKRRLIADVPVGVLLSGGLDSSLIVGLLAEAGQRDLNTYSVGFAGVGEEKGDEFSYSDLIADHFATRHHRIFVENAGLLDSLAATVGAMSEPMVSHDAIGFFLLSQEVAKTIKVVQSGQGADEVFAGYHWYPKMMTAAAQRDPVGAYAAAFFDRDHNETAALVTAPQLERDFSREFVAAHFAAAGAAEAVDKALRLDTTIMLVDDPVKRVDNMTMAWGLEARVPFLDHDLVELAARIPARHKVAEGGKHVLKEAARRVIPAAVIDRPKGYFPVPALKYIRGEVLDFVRDILYQPAAQKRGIFNRDYLAQLLQDPEAHITPLRGSKLWQVALLEYWLQRHNIQ